MSNSSKRQTRRLSRRVHLIAFRVRAEMEALRFDQGKIEKFGYPPDHNLGGLCHDASVRIVALARRAGIRNIRVVDSSDYGHSFVRWNHGQHRWLIDVTATQFNNRRPKVCMLRITSMTRLPHYWQEAV